MIKFLRNQLLLKAEELQDHQEVVISELSGSPAAASFERNVRHLTTTQEEADTKIILHAADAREQDYHRVIVQSKDTDVLVLLIHHELPPEVWMNSSTSKKKKMMLHTSACHPLGIRSDIVKTYLHSMLSAGVIQPVTSISLENAPGGKPFLRIHSFYSSLDAHLNIWLTLLNNYPLQVEIKYKLKFSFNSEKIYINIYIIKLLKLFKYFAFNQKLNREVLRYPCAIRGDGSFSPRNVCSHSSLPVELFKSIEDLHRYENNLSETEIGNLTYNSQKEKKNEY